jgi:hypothetical protein
MNDPALIISFASVGLAGCALASVAALKGWTGWLELKRLELTGAAEAREPRLSSPAVGRIELADLRERVRRLEAIANGAEL